MKGQIYPQIYWPTHCINSEPGHLVGWNHKGLVCCIATVVPFTLHKTVDQLRQRLRELSENSDVEYVSDLKILGEFRARNPKGRLQRPSELWITIDTFQDGEQMERPFLKTLLVSDWDYSKSKFPCQFVFYDQPAFERGHKMSLPSENESSPVVFDSGSSLGNCIRQINCSGAVEQFLLEKERLVNSHASLPTVKLVFSAIKLFLKPANVVFAALLALLTLQLPLISKSLEEVSALAHQVVYRLRSWKALPSLLAQLEKQPWTFPQFHLQSRILSFLVCSSLDIIFGIVVGQFLLLYREEIAEASCSVGNWITTYALKDNVKWFMQAPAGLKLNENLDFCLGYLSLKLFEVWNDIVGSTRDMWNSFIAISAYLGVCGASFLVTMLSDVLSLLTLNLFVVYQILSHVFREMMSALSSLFKLFRGKKYNVLRQRVDHCDYTVEQLLLGTLLFTLVFFITPTVSVYYCFFVLCRRTVLLVKKGLSSATTFLNLFPWYSIALHIVEPRRFSDGLRCSFLPVQEAEKLSSCSPTYLKIESRCAPLGKVINLKENKLISVS